MNSIYKNIPLSVRALIFSVFSAVILFVIGAFLISTSQPVHAQNNELDPADISVGYETTCAVRNAKAYCWGSNFNGKLGVGRWDISRSTTPMAVATNKQKLPADNGDCKSRNWLGICTEYNRDPSPSIPAGAMGKAEVTKISVGRTHVCAIADAEVFCWGDNRYGQLGNKSNSGSLTPVAVHVSNDSVLAKKEMVDVSAGDGFTCALASDHGVYCWGLNDHGQLGNDTVKNSNIPVPVSKETDSKKLCLKTSWSLFGGTKCTDSRTLKRSALAGKKVESLAKLHGKTSTMCVLTSNGEAVCWGSNYVGQVGNNARIPYGSDSGTGYDRHSHSGRCSQTNEAALEEADVDLYEYKNYDALRPTKVSSSQTFDEITITSDEEGDSTYVDLQERIEQSRDVRLAGMSYTYVTAKSKGGQTYYWGGKHVFDVDVDCYSNSDQYYGDYTKTDLKISFNITGNSSPYSTSTMSTMNSGNFRGLGCRVNGGNTAHCDARGTFKLTTGVTGSNFQPKCTTKTGAFGFKYTTCEPEPSGPQKVYTNGWLNNKSIKSIDTDLTGTTCVAVENGQVGCWGENNRGQLGTGDTNNKNVPTAVRF